MRRLTFCLALLAMLIAGTVGAYRIIEVPEVGARTITMVMGGVASGISYLFSDGFESGDNTAWSLGEVSDGDNQLSVSSDAAKTGTYSQKFQILSTDTTHVGTVLSGNYKDVILRMWVQLNDVTAVDTAVGSQTIFKAFNTAGTSAVTQISLKTNESGNVVTLTGYTYENSGAELDSGSISPAADTWYCIQTNLQADTDTDASPNGVIRTYFDATTCGSTLVFESTDINNDELDGIGRVHIGSAAATTWEVGNGTIVYIDDVTIQED